MKKRHQVTNSPCFPLLEKIRQNIQFDFHCYVVEEIQSYLHQADKGDHLSKFIPGIHPQKLIDKGYMNGGRGGAKFGFCSLGPIGDPLKVAGYVTKYITKDLLESNNRFGAHLYFCSIGLRRAQSLGYVYGSYLALDRYLNHHGQFCDVGWAYDLHWSEFLPYLDVSEMFVIDYGPDDEVFIDLTSDQFEQLSMFH